MLGKPSFAPRFVRASGNPTFAKDPGETKGAFFLPPPQILKRCEATRWFAKKSLPSVCSPLVLHAQYRLSIASSSLPCFASVEKKPGERGPTPLAEKRVDFFLRRRVGTRTRSQTLTRRCGSYIRCFQVHATASNYESTWHGKKSLGVSLSGWTTAEGGGSWGLWRSLNSHATTPSRPVLWTPTVL